jgi:hypothetical protein
MFMPADTLAGAEGAFKLGQIASSGSRYFEHRRKKRWSVFVGENQRLLGRHGKTLGR